MKYLIIFGFTFLLFSCQKIDHSNTNDFFETKKLIENNSARTMATIVENFESGIKASYASAPIALSTGSWTLNDALIGNTTSDSKNGTQSVRVRNSGIISSNFDFTTGASTVSVAHGLYGSDAAGTWQLWYSTNAGVSYIQAGSTINTNSTTLQVANFTVNISGNIRLQIRKTDASTNRINFDDITVTSYVSQATTPILSTLSPANKIVGSGAFILTVTGAGFASNSVVNWNGAALATTFVSSTSLSASVSAINIATVGTDSVSVNTAGVPRSNALAFVVQPSPSPVISALSPTSATAGGSAFTLTVSGSNFTNNSVINWTGTALPTTYISSSLLSATVASTFIASAGTASVSVSTTGSSTTGSISFSINASSTTGKRFLFDATKAENAGNADWLLDQDNGTAQRIPTPAQSTITSSTSETYWTGAISSWGIALVKAGHTVETLPSSGTITYGNLSNIQDLSKYDVFVVDEPNKVFTATEKTAIMNFIKNGGGLFMVSDHTGSDRNNDGWDSPAIWNDLMTNNTVQNNPFGFSIDLFNISQVASNILTNNSTNPILNGTAGTVSKLQFSNGTTATLSPTANSTVQGLIWKNSTTQNTANVMAAASAYGSGRVFFVGDSSPLDDGTGSAGNNLFVGWPLYSHTQLFMNASLWLAKVQ